MRGRITVDPDSMKRGLAKSLFGSNLCLTKFYLFLLKLNAVCIILDCFDVLMLKIIFKKWKNIINMYFSTKSYLKNNHYHTAKHSPSSKL